MPDGWRSAIWSTVLPQHFTATVCPPIGLPDPGLTLTASTPPLIASREAQVGRVNGVDGADLRR